MEYEKLQRSPGPPRAEAVFVMGKHCLHLKENENGFAYAAYDIKSKCRTGRGLVSWAQLGQYPVRSPMAAARELAARALKITYTTVAPVALRTLETFPQAESVRDTAWDWEQWSRDIRFIDSAYNTLFYLPDGGNIEIVYPDRSFVAKCMYLDDYHILVGSTRYHICEFAQTVGREGGKYRPEPEIIKEQAAWSVGRHYLTVEALPDGFCYTLYNKEYRMENCGEIANPAQTMNEARDRVLTLLGLNRSTHKAVPFEAVAHNAEKAERDCYEDRKVG